jgi:hypothetical protein
MTRILLVYKQHRFEVLAVLLVSLFLIVGSIVEGYRYSQIHLPPDCSAYTAQSVEQGFWGGPTPSAACMAASRQWLDLHGGIEMNFLPAAPWMVPLLFGILLGAGLVAREIETGTAPLSWALAGSRRRWLLDRMAAMLVLLVPLMLALGLASDFFDAAVQSFNPWASFVDYAGRGVILVFWGLAAFTGTVALSTLFGRTLPAVFVALLVCLFVRGPWEQGANRTFLAPFSEMLVPESQAQSGQFDWGTVYEGALVTRMETWLDGKPWGGDIWQYYMDHPTVVTEPDGSTSVLIGPPNPGEATGVPYPYDVPYGFRGDQYWLVIAYESAILFAGSLFCAAVALFWVSRRRPY